MDSLKILWARAPLLILMSLCITVTSIFQFHLILNAFAPANVSTSFMVFPLAILLATIPITFGGLGLRESAMVFLLAIFSVAEESAMNASLVFYFLNVAPFLCGTLFLPQVAKGFKEWMCSLKSLETSSRQ